jgi:hypothetical protein
MAVEQKITLERIDNPLADIFHQPGSMLTPCSLTLPSDMDEHGWAEIGRRLGRLNQAVQWWIGDWWAFGEGHKYGSRKAIVDADDWPGPSFEVCMNMASICRTFETSRRHEGLTYTHHCEVAGLTKRQADKLLDWCEATIAETGKPRSTRALRDEVQRRAQVAEAKAVRATAIAAPVTYGVPIADPAAVPLEPVIIESTPAAQEMPPPTDAATAIATIEATIAFGLTFMMERHKLYRMLIEAQAAVAVLRTAMAV